MSKKQIDKMVKLMQMSNAVTYEPNVRQIEFSVETAREKYYVTADEGHLTIDYTSLATILYNAGYKRQEWISVDEMLPETEGDYLVWNKERKKIEIRFFYRLPPNYPVESHPEIREYFGNFADYKRITHWMPLPEPPETKGETE